MIEISLMSDQKNGEEVGKGVAEVRSSKLRLGRLYCLPPEAANHLAAVVVNLAQSCPSGNTLTPQPLMAPDQNITSFESRVLPRTPQAAQTAGKMAKCEEIQMPAGGGKNLFACFQMLMRIETDSSSVVSGGCRQAYR